MGQVKSIAFAQSPSIRREESGWSGGWSRASGRDVWARISGNWSGTGTHIVLCLSQGMWYGHSWGLQGGKIQWGSQGYAWGPVCLLWRGWTGLIHLQKGKPRGWWWSSSWHKGEFLWLCSLLCLWSGSLFTTSNILRSIWLPLSTTGVRHLWSYCTAHRAPLGHSRTDGAPQEAHGKCHHFFMLHLSIISSSLEILLGKVIPVPQHP